MNPAMMTISQRSLATILLAITLAVMPKILAIPIHQTPSRLPLRGTGYSVFVRLTSRVLIRASAAAERVRAGSKCAVR
ncbi:hypothetical protein B0H67DRAFT_572208 [Lasiosphaeris hirsuta]|uniref:Uncharacterized protein n=1 Tax=Lasiosphaeris hirsuta TaxID=260670 RepID=A0AA40B1N7_9PEZI|nr:hypothetical protein B0H67DRAFT_572208 [Lasiosphaeris hirsuta]